MPTRDLKTVTFTPLSPLCNDTSTKLSIDLGARMDLALGQTLVPMMNCIGISGEGDALV